MSIIQLPDNSDSQLNFAIQRLMNVGQAGEGSNMPPAQAGQQRVPYVTGFRVLQSAATTAGTQFTLVWNNISSSNINVDHYAIYYTLLGTNSTAQPVGPFIAHQSPAQITVTNTTVTGVTFIIQTVLTNGMSTNVPDSPTTAGHTMLPVVGSLNLNIPSILLGPNGSLLLNGFSWTNNSPIAHSIAWSAGFVTYLGLSYPIPAGNTGTSDFYVYWQLASPYTFQISALIPPLGPDDFMVAINTSSGSPPTTGYVDNPLEIHDNQGQRTLILSGGGVVCYNLDDNPTATLGRTSADSISPPAAGVVRVYNGTGTGGALGNGVQVQLEGTTGNVQCTGITINNGGNPLTIIPDLRTIASPSANYYIPFVMAGQTFYFNIFQ